MNSELSTIVLGSGCFWCTEAAFKMIKGIVATAPGYAGGSTGSPQAAPTYEDVCSGTTGHAEVIKVTYDPAIVSFDDLLTVFFGSHDPTTMNRQGNDVGTQYRSTILYTSEEQKIAAEKYIAELQKDGVSAVTTVEPLKEFYEAEDYHHDYFAKNPTAAYCSAVISPKLKKIKEKLAALLKK